MDIGKLLEMRLNSSLQTAANNVLFNTVLLDNLVVQKCVSLMSQKFSEDLNHQFIEEQLVLPPLDLARSGSRKCYLGNVRLIQLVLEGRPRHGLCLFSQTEIRYWAGF